MNFSVGGLMMFVPDCSHALPHCGSEGCNSKSAVVAPICCLKWP